MIDKKFYHGDLQKEYYFKVGHECFVSVHHKNGKSCATLLGTIDINTGKLESFFESSTAYLKGPLKDFTLKIVGADSLINAVKDQVSHLSFFDLKLVERSGLFEILFIPNDGVLRVSKSVEEVDF